MSSAIGISGRVERYHRTDRYREIVATSENQADVDALAERLREDGRLDRAGTTIHVEVQQGSGRVHPAQLRISIWPHAQRA